MIPDEEEAPAIDPAAVVAVVEAVVRELHPQRKGLHVGLDATLDRDLGLDSLGRVEVVQRLERTFGVRLPESTLVSAESPRDLWRALSSRVASSGNDEHSAFGMAAMEAAEPAPARTRTLLEVLDWHVQRHPDRRHILFTGRRRARGDDLRRSRPPQPRRGGRARARSASRRGRRWGSCCPAGSTTSPPSSASSAPAASPCRSIRRPAAARSRTTCGARPASSRTAEAVVLITFPEVLTLARLLRAQVSRSSA